MKIVLLNDRKIVVNLKSLDKHIVNYLRMKLI